MSNVKIEMLFFLLTALVIYFRLFCRSYFFEFVVLLLSRQLVTGKCITLMFQVTTSEYSSWLNVYVNNDANANT